MWWRYLSCEANLYVQFWNLRRSKEHSNDVSVYMCNHSMSYILRFITYIYIYIYYHKGSKKNELNLYHHYHCSLIVFLFAAFYVATIKWQIITSEVIVWMSSPMIWHYLGYCYIYFVTCVQVSSVNLSSWFCICYEM